MSGRHDSNTIFSSGVMIFCSCQNAVVLRQVGASGVISLFLFRVFELKASFSLIDVFFCCFIEVKGNSKITKKGKAPMITRPALLPSPPASSCE